MRQLSSLLPEKLRILSSIDLTKEGSSSTSLPFPVHARFPSSRVIPSVLRTGEAPSIVPLTRESEDLTLLSPLRRSSLESTGLTNDDSLNVAQGGLSLSDSLNSIFGIWYRFFPEHTQFIGTEFRITNRVKRRLVHLFNSIGLSSNTVPFSVSDLFVYSRLGCGVRSLVTDSGVPKKVIEVLTFFNGMYGRLIILVSTGVGCTVWYTFVPGVPEIAPLELCLPRIISYNTFLDVNHEIPPFHKLCFIETKYIAEEVLSAFENVYPFNEIPIPNENVYPFNENPIPNNNNARVAIGLGIMVAVFIAIGIAPNITSSSSNLINATL